MAFLALTYSISQIDSSALPRSRSSRDRPHSLDVWYSFRDRGKIVPSSLASEACRLFVGCSPLVCPLLVQLSEFRNITGGTGKTATTRRGTTTVTTTAKIERETTGAPRRAGLMRRQRIQSVFNAICAQSNAQASLRFQTCLLRCILFFSLSLTRPRVSLTRPLERAPKN